MFRLVHARALVRHTHTVANYQLAKTGRISESTVLFRRLLSTDSATSDPDDIRARLMVELKGAMKTKDTLKSTTIRSVLSEVYAADKIASVTSSSSVVAGILRKAAARRINSASEFANAARPDLAEKEQQEAAIIEAFLPSLLSQDKIDDVLEKIMLDLVLELSGPPQKVLGLVLKEFYAKVDKANVDPNLVRQRAQWFLSR